MRSAANGDALRRDERGSSLALRGGGRRGDPVGARFGRKGDFLAAHPRGDSPRLAAREREGRVTGAQAADLLAIFAQASSTWAVLELTEAVAQRAEDGFPSEPVRTLGAIHLASALFLRQSFPELAILTADERVRANAVLLGLRAERSPT